MKKRLPWFSLLLMLLSYTTWGWILSETKAPLSVWVVSVMGVLLLMAALATPQNPMAKNMNLLINSDVKSFLVSVAAGLLLFLMLAWFRLFLDALLIITAAILVRIDFQTAAFNPRVAFTLSLIFSLTGLGMGKVAYMMAGRYL